MNIMGATVVDRLADVHRVLPENARGSMAKADLRKPDTDAWKPRIGRALQRAVSLCGWSLKEFAGAVDRDPRQCARWLDGSERPQLDALFAVETFRQPLVQALSELAGAEVEVTVRLRRAV